MQYILDDADSVLETVFRLLSGYYDGVAGRWWEIGMGAEEWVCGVCEGGLWQSHTFRQ